MLTPGAYEDRRSLQLRLTGLRIGLLTVFVLIAGAFWVLQVLQYTEYRDRAEQNHTRTIPLLAPRGVLFDRHGDVLVQNRRSFRIAIVREQTADIDDTIRHLAGVTGTAESDIQAIMTRRRGDPLFRPIAVIDHATDAQVAAVIAQGLELPGVVVDQIPMRSYPGEGAHLFGYVGEVQQAQLYRPEFAGLQPGAIVGQAGLEQVYNAPLMGNDGNRFVIVDSRGREIDELERQDPVDGQRVKLTIDRDMQRALEDAFRADGFDGAAAFLDPRSGEVLALTSLPAYDPNDFAVGISSATWSALNKDPLRPLGNRLIQGLYSPGSTFKIVMAITALEEGIITPDTVIGCRGSGVFYGRSFKCWNTSGHGPMTLRHAIEQSCNVFFYTLGERLNARFGDRSIDAINKWAAKLGLVGKTGIDLPQENPSLVPSTEWKLRERGERWYPGETISVAIGQGAVSVSPMAMATMMATVANGGTLQTPHLLKAIDRGHGWEPQAPPAPRSVFQMDPSHLAAVRDGLWMAVNTPLGTATRRGKIDGKDVAGKTGTAQVISNDNKAAAQAAARSAGKDPAIYNDHGWFVFFAPRDNPEVAGVVFTEHSEHGYLSAPIAKHVMETYFAKKEGRPLPVYKSSRTPRTPVAPPRPAIGGTSGIGGTR
ncbi:MAG: penicillin-binding protein 2 [Acidobacteria bacterium]|nr:penicillin-binding protein 2 [Acidobacteriota bacterium]